MARLRKTLPSDLDDLLSTGTFDEITAVLEGCQPNAAQRNFYAKRLLHFPECPDEVVRWALERGEDINGRDKYDRTPLHRAVIGHDDRVELLLSLGADVDPRDYQQTTPLMVAAEYTMIDSVNLLLDAGADPNAHSSGRRDDDVLSATLARSENPASIRPVIDALLAAGAVPADRAAAPLRRLGTDLEHAAAHGRRMSADVRDDLDHLYRVLDVEPVAPLQVHDGSSPIVLAEGSWKKQYRSLWDSLVPPAGRADTAQGEAVRLIGRIGNEISGNAGANWDRAYRQLADQLAELLGSGTPLPDTDLTTARRHLSELRDGSLDFDAVDEVTELVVRWVGLNPDPVPNSLPDVGR